MPFACVRPALTRPPAAAGSPRRPRRTPRRRRAARRARRRRRRRGSRAGSTRTPRAAPGARPPGTTSDFSSTPRATSTSRSAARATSPLWEANGAAVARSACTTAATSSAGAVGRRGQQLADAAQPVGRRGVAGPAAALVGQRPAAASAWIRASACSGERASAGASAEQLGRDPHRVGRDLVAGARRAPRPAWRAEPSSTALAWAPRSRDSAVVSGEVRRRPRSRSITSMPSRAAAYADGHALEGRPARRNGSVLTGGRLPQRVR